MRNGAPQIGPRTDFPVRRLVEKMFLGNLIVFGGCNLMMMVIAVLESLNYIRDDSFSDLPEVIADASEDFVETLREEWWVTALLFVVGCFFGLVWYSIARWLETRKMRKRFGILKKPCTEDKVAVKSPHS